MKVWTGVLLMLIVWALAACEASASFEGAQLQADSSGVLTPLASGTPDNKLGICHNTGSASNPWVYEEIDGNAIPAHQKMGDVFGVHSQAECDALSVKGTPTNTPSLILTPVPTLSNQQGKVGICHRTGSTTNPYVYIVVSVNAVNAHRKHGDIIGVASPNDCPKTALSNGNQGNDNENEQDDNQGNDGNGHGNGKGKDTNPGHGNGKGNGNND